MCKRKVKRETTPFKMISQNGKNEWPAAEGGFLKLRILSGMDMYKRGLLQEKYRGKTTMLFKAPLLY
jgi:hypothetical protein